MRRVIASVIILFSAGFLSAATVWVEKNLYSSGSSLNPGDIIRISIDDISSIQFSMDIKGGESLSVDSSPDVTISGFLPKVISTKNIKNENNLRYNSKNRMSAVIAARVTGRDQAGKLAVAGTRTYSFDGKTNTVNVRGTVDPSLVVGDLISSASVSDFRMEIRSTVEGVGIRRQAPGPDEQAAVTLTEAEKRELIVQYLEKMLSIIGR